MLAVGKRDKGREGGKSRGGIETEKNGENWWHGVEDAMSTHHQRASEDQLCSQGISRTENQGVLSWSFPVMRSSLLSKPFRVCSNFAFLLWNRATKPSEATEPPSGILAQSGVFSSLFPGVCHFFFPYPDSHMLAPVLSSGETEKVSHVTLVGACPQFSHLKPSTISQVILRITGHCPLGVF